MVAQRRVTADTWNLAEVEIIAGRRRLRARFARVAALWFAAFVTICAVSIFGFGAAEAAPIARLGAASLPGPAVSMVIAGMLTGAGGLTALLWQRMLRPGAVRRSSRLG